MTQIANTLFAAGIDAFYNPANPSLQPGQVDLGLDSLNHLTFNEAGVLNYDAVFDLTLNGGTPVPVLVTAASTANNQSLSALAGEINSALVTAGIGNVVTASINSFNQVVFTAAAASLEITRFCFGVYVDSQGNLYDWDGDLTGSGKLYNDPTQAARSLEVTGLDRMLGAPKRRPPSSTGCTAERAWISWTEIMPPAPRPSTSSTITPASYFPRWTAGSPATNGRTMP